MAIGDAPKPNINNSESRKESRFVSGFLEGSEEISLSIHSLQGPIRYLQSRLKLEDSVFIERFYFYDGNPERFLHQQNLTKEEGMYFLKQEAEGLKKSANELDLEAPDYDYGGEFQTQADPSDYTSRLRKIADDIEVIIKKLG